MDFNLSYDSFPEDFPEDNFALTEEFDLSEQDPVQEPLSVDIDFSSVEVLLGDVTGNQELLLEQLVIQQDQLQISLDRLHGDCLLIFLMLLLSFARLSLHAARDYIIHSWKAVK